MRLSRNRIGVLSLMAFGLLTCAHGQQKRRVAVLSFTLGDEAKLQARNSLGVQSDLGRDLSDQLVNRLVNDGKFVVVERTALDKYVTPEILRTNSDGFDSATAAKLGKLAGADSIIVGAVTQLTVSNVPTNGTLSVLTGGNIDKRKITIEVAATARVIDTNSAVILSSATGSGQSTKNTTVMKDTKTGKTVLDTGGSVSGNGPMHDAMLQAINMMASQLEAAPSLNAVPTSATATAMARVAYKSTVADVSGDTLILMVGSKGGAQIGDVVEIDRVSRLIHAPDNPAVVIKTIYELVGTAKVTELDESTATATFSGPGKPKLKDAVSFKPPVIP